jgi:hypothetical protein
MRRKIAARSGVTAFAALAAGWALFVADAPYEVVGAAWALAVAAAFLCALALESR